MLDACVLYPIALCNALLSAADRRLYRPAWTEQILEETARALVRNGRDPDKVRYRVEEMKAAYPEAMVDGYEDLIPAMKTHEKDRHVAAAAVRSSSELIISTNIRDFPDEALRCFGVRAISADEFLMDLLGWDPDAMMQVVDDMVGSSSRPTLTRLDVLKQIAKNAPKFAAGTLMCFESASDDPFGA